MDHTKQLGESKILPLLIKFSIPAMIGMIVNALYNVVDRIYVGWGVGHIGITGITVGFPMMIIMMAFGMLIGIGATALISIRLGEKNKDDAELIMGNAFSLLILVALILTTLGLIFLDPLLKLFAASEEALPYAKQYLSIILFGAVFQNIGFGMNNFIRGEGNPRVAASTMIIGAVVNIILDPIFIFVFDMGVRGAAIATVISMAVSSAWVLYYFLGGKSLLKIHLKNIRIRMTILLKIFEMGSAPFAMQMAASILTILLNNILKSYGGDLALATMGIINSLTMFILMPIFGINQAAQPIIGYNYGARNFDRVKATLKYAIAGATFIVLIGFAAAQIFPRQMISIFAKNDQELIAMGSEALRIFLVMLPLIGFQIVSANYFQAVGKPKHAMVLSLSRQVLILIPALIILPRFFGLHGIFYAGPLSDFLSSAITAVWLFWELRHLDNKHKEVQDEALKNEMFNDKEAKNEDMLIGTEPQILEEQAN